MRRRIGLATFAFVLTVFWATAGSAADPKLPDPNDPPVADRDDDRQPDAEDNCLATPNPTQEDRDGDGLGDACDDDDDGDGVPDGSDRCPYTFNPRQLNADGDLLADACDTDDDNDGLPDSLELEQHTDPRLPDTDGDGFSDLTELLEGADPLRAEEYPGHLVSEDGEWVGNPFGCAAAPGDAVPAGGVAAFVFLAVALLASGLRRRGFVAVALLLACCLAGPSAAMTTDPGHGFLGDVWAGEEGGARGDYAARAGLGVRMAVDPVVYGPDVRGKAVTAVEREWLSVIELALALGDLAAVHVHVPYVTHRSGPASFAEILGPGLGDITLRAMLHSREETTLGGTERSAFAGSVGFTIRLATGDAAALRGDGAVGGGILAAGELIGPWYGALLTLSADVRHRGSEPRPFGVFQVGAGLALHTPDRGLAVSLQGFGGATTDADRANGGLRLSVAARNDAWSVRLTGETDLAAMGPGAAPARVDLVLGWSL